MIKPMKNKRIVTGEANEIMNKKRFVALSVLEEKKYVKAIKANPKLRAINRDRSI